MALYAAFAVQIILMVGFPIWLWPALRRRLGASWGLIVAGGVTFIASQVVHLPLNGALGLLGSEPRGVALWPLPALAAVVGLSAGVCEEGARYLVLRYWQRRARSWEDGVAYGAGHGGVESLLLGLSVGASLVTMMVLRQQAAPLPTQLQEAVESFWSLDRYMPLLGGVERLFAIAVQISLALLVMRAVAGGNPLWLLTAILFHAGVDGVPFLLLRRGWAVPAVEAVVLGFALTAVAIILALRQNSAHHELGDPL